MCIYNEINYVEKVKDIEFEKESEDVSHSGFGTDKKALMKVILLVVQLA